MSDSEFLQRLAAAQNDTRFQWHMARCFGRRFIGRDPVENTSWAGYVWRGRTYLTEFIEHPTK